MTPYAEDLKYLKELIQSQKGDTFHVDKKILGSFVQHAIRNSTHQDSLVRQIEGMGQTIEDYRKLIVTALTRSEKCEHF